MPFQRPSLIAAAILSTSLFLSCERGSTATTDARPSPIIFISIDTLRSDRLPAYGYEKIQTPNIDALRSDGLLFERAYSHSPLTAPSHASVLTGVLPGEHGIRDNAGFRLRSDLPTLPELLREQGYRSGAAVSSFVLTGADFARGFDFFEGSISRTNPDQGLGREQRPGEQTLEHAKRWLGEQTGDRFFFLLHLYEPHTPYDAPEPYRSAATDPYDAEILHADALVGDFIRFLKSQEIYDRAAIVLFSDHGEGLNDHGEAEHGLFLYREAIQVPLIVKLPQSQKKGSTLATPVQLADLFPTALEVAAAPAAPRLANARSLQSISDTDAPRRIYSESYYGRIHFGWSDLHSLTDGKSHYIHAPAPELYDLATDFAERINVIGDHRRLHAAWRDEIAASIMPLENRQDISPEEAAKLAALGYLGSSSITDPGELEDPKSQIETFTRIKRAYGLFHDGRLQEALSEFDAILGEHPDMADLWALKMSILSRLGDPAGGIEAGKRALQLAPSSSAFALTVATLSLQINRLDDAQRHAELALEREPGSAHGVLARVWLARGNLERAEDHARQALEARPDEPLPLMTLAAVELERKNAASALALLDRAAASIRARGAPQISMLSFMRGDALARLGRNREAEVAFFDEIRFVPADPRAYSRLVLLYLATGRESDAAALMSQLVERSPRPESYLALVQTLHAAGDREGAAYWARAGASKFPDHRSLQEVARRL